MVIPPVASLLSFQCAPSAHAPYDYYYCRYSEPCPLIGLIELAIAINSKLSFVCTCFCSNSSHILLELSNPAQDLWESGYWKLIASMWDKGQVYYKSIGQSGPYCMGQLHGHLYNYIKLVKVPVSRKQENILFQIQLRPFFYWMFHTVETGLLAHALMVYAYIRKCACNAVIFEPHPVTGCLCDENWLLS